MDAMMGYSGKRRDRAGTGMLFAMFLVRDAGGGHGGEGQQ